MKTITREKIYQFIKERGQVRPHELGKHLGTSQVSVHRQLKLLLQENRIQKIGKAPMVFYIPKEVINPKQIPQLAKETEDFIEQTYLYVTPNGQLLYGVKGFYVWVEQTGQIKFYEHLATEYTQMRNHANSLFTKDGWVDATKKVHAAFPNNTWVDTVIYKDFYALPKFGKTKFGQLVLHAKQAQNKELITQLAIAVKPTLEKIIQKYNINAIAFLPHSIPRAIPFLKELRTNLRLPLQQIDLVKAYAGEIPVAQKSLGKLEERVENARGTIFVKAPQNIYKTVLLIDDAVGSGATFNETAHKLKQDYGVKTVIGFAIVGSMKGFEVIREI